MLKIFIWTSFFFVNSWFSTASYGWGGVIVFDRVTTLKTPIYVKVLTKGRFFARGGRLVDIYVNDKKLKQILTGGDGYGYLKYTAQGLGLTKIEARANGDRNTGVILVVGKTDKIILIEVESGFRDSLLSNTVREGSRKAIERLSQKYKIIYLNTFFGAGISKKWLKNEKFPESATLRWQGPKMLKSLKEKGIHLYAIVGSAGLISDAAKYFEKRYTFEETKNGQTVKNWEEISNLLHEEPEEQNDKKNNFGDN